MTDHQFPASEAQGLAISKDENLHKHCTYLVGGPADYFAEPSSIAQLRAILQDAAKLSLPVTVIGKGSNLLISDKGIRGVVISLSDEIGRYGYLEKEPQRTDYEDSLQNLLLDPKPDSEGNVWLFAEAGASMIEVALAASQDTLTGLEFASGIPGSVGGALFMNAGAYGGMTQEVAAITWYLAKDGELRSAVWDEQAFGYRKSFFQEVGGIVLATCYRLRKGDKQEIQATVEDLRQRREKSQPLELPSCGSVFKRPEGYYAGKLIMDSGLQGYRIGGAEVSTKHAGFIVNQGGANAQNIADLIAHIQRTVLEKYEVRLETEVRFLGDW